MSLKISLMKLASRDGALPFYPNASSFRCSLQSNRGLLEVGGLDQSKSSTEARVDQSSRRFHCC
jgi:hypothetical protein